VEATHGLFKESAVAVPFNLPIFTEDSPVRVAYQEQSRLDCPPVNAVPLNLNCRDEIIPILRALQHVYGQVQLRREILDLIGNDVNAGSSPNRGREGLSYWTITVLALKQANPVLFF
jgi:hypothetical protein